MRSRRGCKQERSVRIELRALLTMRGQEEEGDQAEEITEVAGKWSNQESLVFCGSQVKKVISRTSVHLCQRLQTLVACCLNPLPIY